MVDESGMDEEEVLKGIKELFPDFGQSDIDTNHLFSDYAIEQYAYSKSLGMGTADAAHSANVTVLLMERWRKGIGLSLKNFVTLAKYELYSNAEMMKKHLTSLDTISSQKEDYRATVAFLEKVYPEKYGPKASISHSGAIGGVQVTTNVV